MRWLLPFLRRVFSFRRSSTGRRRHHLMGMYFDESNSTGRRKANRDRA
jgi:hypothetical protein